MAEQSLTPAVESVDKDSADQKKLDLLKFVLQLFHLVLAAVILLVGIVEFSVEPSVFDVFGKERTYYLVSWSIIVVALRTFSVFISL